MIRVYIKRPKVDVSVFSSTWKELKSGLSTLLNCSFFLVSDINNFFGLETMNRIITLLAMSVALSAAMSVPNVYHKTSNPLRQEQLAALINQLLREKQVYQEVKRECLRMGPLGCLNGTYCNIPPTTH